MERIKVNSIDNLVDELYRYIGKEDTNNKCLVFRCQNVSEMTEVYVKLTERCNASVYRAYMNENEIKIVSFERKPTLQLQSVLTHGTGTTLEAKVATPVGRLQDFNIERDEECLTIVGVLNDVLLGNVRDKIDYEIELEN